PVQPSRRRLPEMARAEGATIPLPRGPTGAWSPAPRVAPGKGLRAAVRFTLVNLLGPAVGVDGRGAPHRGGCGRASRCGDGGCVGLGGDRARAGWTPCNRGHGVARWARRWSAGLIALRRIDCSAVVLSGLPGGGLSRLPRGGPGG